jgi:hypothetical protein
MAAIVDLASSLAAGQLLKSSNDYKDIHVLRAEFDEITTLASSIGKECVLLEAQRR